MVVVADGMAALKSDVGEGADAVLEVPFEEALALRAVAEEGLQEGAVAADGELQVVVEGA